MADDPWAVVSTVPLPALAPAQGDQGLTSVIDVGHSYDPKVPAGQPGSEMAPVGTGPSYGGTTPTITVHPGATPGAGKDPWAVVSVRPITPPPPGPAAPAAPAVAPAPAPAPAAPAPPIPSGTGPAMVPTPMVPQQPMAAPQQPVGAPQAPAPPPRVPMPQAPVLPPQQPVQGTGMGVPGGQGPPQPDWRPPPPTQYTLPGATAPVPTWITHPMDVLGTSIARGMAGIPFGLADLVNAGARYAGMPLYSGSGLDWINRQIDPTGQGVPTGQGEQLLANIGTNVGANLPLMALGPEASLGRALMARVLAPSLGAGAGQTVAQRAELGPLGEIGGTIAGDILGRKLALPVLTAPATAYRTARALRMAGTDAGQQALAGAELARMSSTGGTLPATLRGAPHVGLPGVPRSTGTVAADLNLMRAEHALRAMPEGTDLVRMEQARQQAVATALRGMTGGPARTVEQRGDAIRDILQRQEAMMGQRTDDLYNAARAQPGSASLKPVLPEIGRIHNARFGPGGGPAPAAWRRIAQQIAERSAAGNVDASWLINMDKQLGNEARMAGRSGDATAAGAYRDLQREVGKLSPNAAYDAAKRYRAQVGQVTGRDTTGAHAAGDILKTDLYGRPMTANDKVVGKIFSQGPGAVRQLMNAADEAIDAARASGNAQGVRDMTMAKSALENHLRNSFVDGAFQQRIAGGMVTGPGTTAPVFSNAKWQTFWNKNQQIAGQLFDRGEIATFKQIGDQLGEDAAVLQTRKAQGSDTAQIIAQAAGRKGTSPTVAGIFNVATQGRLSPDSGLGRLLVGTVNRVPTMLGAAIGMKLGMGEAGAVMAAHYMGGEHLVQSMAGHSDEMIHAMITNAIADPVFARQILQKADEAGLLKAMTRSAQSGGAFAAWLRQTMTQAARLSVSAPVAVAQHPDLSRVYPAPPTYHMTPAIR